MPYCCRCGRTITKGQPFFYQGGIKFGPAQVLFKAMYQLMSQMEEVVSPLLVLHSTE